MTYTKNYNLKKPAGTDAYNIADFNGNMDIIDSQLKAVGGGWVEIPLTEFADMGQLDDDRAAWSVDVKYNSALKMAKLHFNTIDIGVTYRTGQAIGTIKTPYRPAFTQYGIALITTDNNQQLTRAFKVATDGTMVIENLYDGFPADNIHMLVSADIICIVA